MPFKIFSAPGDHRDDYETVEKQVNSWLGENAEIRIRDWQFDITPLNESRDTKSYVMTIVVHYE